MLVGSGCDPNNDALVKRSEGEEKEGSSFFHPLCRQCLETSVHVIPYPFPEDINEMHF
jgi:hypothetical protein